MNTAPATASQKRRPWNAIMSRAELFAAGCAPWDDELMLFPAGWFDEIPIGFEVTTIRGDLLEFDNAVANRDTRYGLLAYGVIAR